MGSEDNPLADRRSESAFPTVEELISQLRSSFFSLEFQYVTKTLKDREQRIKEENMKLKTKVEEEKSLLISENLKLNDELKKKQVEIDAMRKVNAEYERNFRDFEKRPLEFDRNAMSLKKLARELMGSGSSCANLENKEPQDRAAEKKDSKKKTEPKLTKIILIDDDDDDQGIRVSHEIKKEHNSDDNDDLEYISTIRRRPVLNEFKKEYNADGDDLKFISATKRRRVSNETKREHHRESANISPFLEEIDSDSSASDSGSDSGKISKAYMFSIAKMKKQKERWETESDMVKDLEKDDELCLNGICAIHRQRIIVHGTDISRMSNLACKLIDGDSQKRLKKKASELNQFDLDHCRMFAKKYSLQLFNIYQKKCDPFFPTSRSQEKRSHN